MKQCILLCLIIFISWNSLFSINKNLLDEDKYQLSGKVFDEQTGKPLIGANIFVPKINAGGISGIDGNFLIKNIPTGVHIVIVRYVGYKEISDTINFSGNVNKNYSLLSEAIELSQILIQGEIDKTGLNGSSQSIAVLSQEDIDKHRGQTFGKALTNIPGVTVLSTGPAITKPVIRGLHSQRILIFNNNIKQEGQQWGAEHGPEIDPFIPSRIELIKGAASLEYGSDAIGGVIKVVPLNLPKNNEFGGKLSFNGFSNNMQGSSSLMLEGGSDFIKGFGFRLQGSLRKAGDSKTSKYNISNTGFNEKNASLTLGINRDKFSIETFYSRFNTELGIFLGSHIGNVSDLRRAIESNSPLIEFPFTYEIKNPRQEISHDLFALRTKLNINNYGILEIDYGWQFNHRKEYDAHRPFSDSLRNILLNKPAFDLKLTTYNIDARFRHRPIGKFTGTFGISGVKQSNSTQGTSFLIPNFNVYGGGIYLREEFIEDKITFSGGLRYDYKWMNVIDFRGGNRKETLHEFNNLSGAFGTVYKFNNIWSLAFNFGTAWRPPGISELYSNGVHHGTANFEIGDKNLITEKSYSFDLTLRHITENTHLEISSYSYFINDYIYLKPLDEFTLTIRGAFPTFKYIQTNARLVGLDGFIKHDLNSHLGFIFSASYLYADDLNNKLPLIFMPSNRASLTAHFHFDDIGIFKDSYLELTGNVVAKQTRYTQNSDFVPPPPGYFLLNASIGSEIILANQRLQINLSAENLLNKTFRDYLSRYRYFIDDVGFNIILRFQYFFGTLIKKGVI